MPVLQPSASVALRRQVAQYQGVTDRIFNTLFLCTGNSARSIMAESILRKDGAGRFRAFSAGSHPTGRVNPFALKVLANFDYPTEGLSSKNWNSFAVPDVPIMDFVFTVCDSAAEDACPRWPGQPMSAHWGIGDPALAEGTELQKEAAFVTAFRYLKARIEIFTALQFERFGQGTLGATLHEIGCGEGATRRR